ncbi:MAG TPA: HD domain-containing protein [Planctomycetota bacterium]|nr:HD domain-containing protein [Planctomycetota bacterium]HRR82571.1 HD domain-containing protein [Planctomycetota bacterium]HRT95392.1 HD domain-containing protein [Planctomycetota bacterium]
MTSTPKTECALALALRRCADTAHLRHVARLADLLFDALRPLHRLGEGPRELLACAALLHDIGLDTAITGHHRAALRLILEAHLPALSLEEKRIVANVARYHRKALPSPRHPEFRLLSPPAQGLVCRLAALLRVADGLDRDHTGAVASLSAALTRPGAWTLWIDGPGDLEHAAWGAARKADLFERAYGAKLVVTPRPDRDGTRNATML